MTVFDRLRKDAKPTKDPFERGMLAGLILGFRTLGYVNQQQWLTFVNNLSDDELKVIFTEAKTIEDAVNEYMSTIPAINEGEKPT